MKKLRIGIAFFYHESHSFTPLKTDLQSFYDEGYFKGNEIFLAYRGTKTEVGGFIDVLDQKEFIEIVPLVCAAAIPSGIVTYDTYLEIERDIVEGIELAAPLDGLLLALHGAMVVEGIHDPEVQLLSKIRNMLGKEIPIATTLDMHANLSAEIIEYTPYHFGFKTYPHVDMYHQGVKAAEMLIMHMIDDQRFEAAFVKLPMMLPSVNMRTIEGPMHEMIEYALALEEKEGIQNVSIFGGFPYSDVPSVGASVLVIAKNKSIAEKIAHEVSRKFWELKSDYLMELPDVQKGFEVAESLNESKPIVLADISDNPLSCGSGDTTTLLREFLKKNLCDTLFGGLTDPESIEKCRNAGVGASVELNLGGKISPEFGLPVKVMAKVMALSDGVFYNSGPFNQNLRVDVKGAAFIKVGEVDLLLIGRPMSANDPEMFRQIGIESTNYKILGLKVKNHFRAAFDPIISKVIYVDAPGVASNNFTNFPYKNIPSDIWPLKEMENPFQEGVENGN